MTKKSLTFGIQLILLLAVVAGLHWSYLHANEIEIPVQTMALSYIVNYVMALGIYITLLIMAGDGSKYIGFVFLIGSAFKFLVYFIIFDPLFRQDGELSRVEFFLFFIPYLVCLVAETMALVKLLRSLD